MFRRLLCLVCLDDPAKELCHQNDVGLPLVFCGFHM